MKNNEALQETMEMSAIAAVEEEELDMKQDKYVEGDLIATVDEMMKPEEGFDVDSLIARIDAKIKELEEKEKCLGAEEEKIIECIKAALDEHGLKYSYDPERAKMVEVGFGADNKVFRMMIILQNEKVIFRLSFPFRVQCNTLALVSLYMAQFNENKAFSLMNLDLDDGEATMEYSYLLGKAEEFNKEHFWIYLMSLVHPAQEAYTRLSHLAVGKVSKDVKNLYMTLLEQSLAVINGEDEEEESVIYGCEDLQKGKDSREEFLKRLIHDRKSLSDLDDDDDTFPFGFLGGDDSRPHGIPTFEEFMRMKHGEAESKKDNAENVANSDIEDIFLPFVEDDDDELDATGTEE